MGKTYGTQSEEATKFELYGSTSPQGKKETGFFKIEDIPLLKQLIAEVKYLRSAFSELGLMGKDALDKQGLNGTKSAIGNTYKMVENSELILKDEEVYAMEYIGAYVSKYMKITNISHGALPDGFSADGTWKKNEDGIYERDIDKVAKVVL